MVVELFKQEVPELEDETVGIERIVREAGYRTKMAVTSFDQKVDPLGACVGVRGTRVKNIIRELNNEKIDIVPWTDDKVQLLYNLLDPIEPKKVDYDPEENKMVVIVSDEDYPVAIGKTFLSDGIVSIKRSLISSRDRWRLRNHQTSMNHLRLKVLTSLFSMV